MTKIYIRSCLIKICLVVISGAHSAVAMQSLADAARREAERRDRLQRSGIAEKVMEGKGGCFPEEGNVSIFTPSGGNPQTEVPASPASRSRRPLPWYRKELQKLDKAILTDEARLIRLKDRLKSLKRKSLEIGNFKGFSRNEESRARVEVQIEELQVDLKRLRKERTGVYDSGRRDGFLPGELEGKGIIP